MNGYARCTVPPILVNARPPKNGNNNGGSSSLSPRGGNGGDERGFSGQTPKRTSEDREQPSSMSQHNFPSSSSGGGGHHNSSHHHGRRKKSVRFTETPDEVVGTAEDIDRTSISAPKRCDACNVHLVGFVWECRVCCEGEKEGTTTTMKNGNGENLAMATTTSRVGEHVQNASSPSCEGCEEIVGVGNMAVREKERVKSTMLEIGPQSPHQSQGTVFNSGSNTASIGGGVSTASGDKNNLDGDSTAPEGEVKKGFRLCVSCYQMHARLSMSRTRFLEERKRKEEENRRKLTISSPVYETTTASLPAPVLNATASVPTTEATTEEKESVFSAGQNNNSLWLQLVEQLQIHEHDPQNFIRTGLDDQMALEEIIRDRATLMVNGEDRLGRILKEATRRMDAAKQSAEESPYEIDNSNGMHQAEEELAPAL